MIHPPREQRLEVSKIFTLFGFRIGREIPQ
jgi:hypothetical protein